MEATRLNCASHVGFMSMVLQALGLGCFTHAPPYGTHGHIQDMGPITRQPIGMAWLDKSAGKLMTIDLPISYELDGI